MQRKNRQKISPPGVGQAILSLVLAVGTQTVFRPCIHEDGNFGTCHDAGLALTGIGVLLLILSVVGLFVKNKKAGALLCVGRAVLALAAIIVPGRVIPLCMMNTMRCNRIMRPASLVLAVLILALNLLDLVWRRKA